MSLTLRFAKEYKVEMSSNTFGNYDVIEIENLLIDLSEENDSDLNEVLYFNEDSNDFEIGKKRLVCVIKGIKNMSDEEYQEYEISEPKENLITFFEDALANAEPSIDYVKFEWA
jgi:hypothetical protein